MGKQIKPTIQTKKIMDEISDILGLYESNKDLPKVKQLTSNYNSTNLGAWCDFKLYSFAQYEIISKHIDLEFESFLSRKNKNK